MKFILFVLCALIATVLSDDYCIESEVICSNINDLKCKVDDVHCNNIDDLKCRLDDNGVYCNNIPTEVICKSVPADCTIVNVLYCIMTKISIEMGPIIELFSAVPIVTTAAPDLWILGEFTSTLMKAELLAVTHLFGADPSRSLLGCFPATNCPLNPRS